MFDIFTLILSHDNRSLTISAFSLLTAMNKGASYKIKINLIKVKKHQFH